jgi:SRSO17 transposase
VHRRHAIISFLSESPWDPDAVNERRLELVVTDPATAPHEAGVLVLDDSGDRKAGTKAAHVARQYLGSIGKIDGRIVAVTSLWADARLSIPCASQPYMPPGRLSKGKADPDFRTKLQLAVELIAAALEAGCFFQAVVVDYFYRENATGGRAGGGGPALHPGAEALHWSVGAGRGKPYPGRIRAGPAVGWPR